MRRADGMMEKCPEERANALEGREATKILLEIMRTTGNEQTPVNAAEALGKLGQREAAGQMLLELTQTASEDWVRKHAAKALGQLGERSEFILNSLLELARTASDEMMRNVAYGSLKRLLT